MLTKKYGDKCSRCGFWNDARSADTSDFVTGQCQRNPPGFDDRNGLAVWPFTEEAEWCGEFKLNPDAPNDDDED